MNEEDVKEFLGDFKKSELDKKLDMWFFALDQEAIWEEIISEMSDIATKDNIGKAAMKRT